MKDAEAFVSSKVRKMPFSGIRRFFDVANEMDGVVSLGVGEPDFATPWPIREKAIQTLERGKTTYTSNSGLMELRQEISNYFKRTIGVEYDPKKNIVVTVGASESIDLAFRALIDPGDEVIIPEPSFVCYKPSVELAGGMPVVIETKVENQFKLMPDELLAKITPKTKLLLLPYPNNPTGAIMDNDDLSALVQVLKDKDIMVISDEIYSELTYGSKHVSIASFEEMKEKTVVINGFSKSYAMTGWRLGYAAGPTSVISAMTKVHQYCIMCAPTMSQYAAVEALRECEDYVNKMRSEYDMRRRVMRDGFLKMGLDCFDAKGAFYLFPSIKSTGLSSDEFCERLLFEEKVAVVPGNALGECGEGHIRCSYAYSIEEIKKALDIIERFVKKVRGE